MIPEKEPEFLEMQRKTSKGIIKKGFSSYRQLPPVKDELETSKRRMTFLFPQSTLMKLKIPSPLQSSQVSGNSNSAGQNVQLQLPSEEEKTFKEPFRRNMSLRPPNMGSNLPGMDGAMSTGLAYMLNNNQKIQARRKNANKKRLSDIQLTKQIHQQGKWYLVKLGGKFKKMWETQKAFLLMYQFFYLPLRLAFWVEDPSILLYVLDKLIDVMLCIDVFLNFFTPIYKNFDIVTNLKEIAKDYLKTWFLLDFLSVFPFDECLSAAMNGSAEARYGGLVQMLRLVRFMRLSKMFLLMRALDIKNNESLLMTIMHALFGGSSLMMLVPNFILILFVFHLFTCIWYILAMYETSTNNSWIVVNNDQNQSLGNLYVLSMYLVVQTLTTTGYGDIHSVTKDEQSFRIIMMILAVVMYGLFTGQIVNFRNYKMEQEESHFIKVQKLDEIRRDYKLDDVLYQHMIEALEFVHSDREVNRKDFSSLSNEDLDRLDYLRFIPKFKELKFFDEDSFPEEFHIRLGRLMKKVEHKAEQIIYSKGEDSVLFYFLLSGQVAVMKEDIDSIPLLKISKGYFGELEIIEGCNRKYTIKTLTDCVLYYIESIDFKKLFTEDLEFWDNFRKKAHQREAMIIKSNKEMDFFIRRKAFWKLIFKGKKKEKKATMKKLILSDEFKHKPRVASYERNSPSYERNSPERPQ